MRSSGVAIFGQRSFSVKACGSQWRRWRLAAGNGNQLAGQRGISVAWLINGQYQCNVSAQCIGNRRREKCQRGAAWVAWPQRMWLAGFGAASANDIISVARKLMSYASVAS